MDTKKDYLLWFIKFLIKELKAVVSLCLQINLLLNLYLKDNIWAADLADMQLISKFNKGFRFLLCVIDIYSKYAWVVPLKDKKGLSIVNAFQKNSKQSARKPNKIWVDKGSEFYNSHFK